MSYLGKEKHNVQPGLMETSTLKPQPFSPVLPSKEMRRSSEAHARTPPSKTFKRSKRLSRSRRDKHKSVNIAIGNVRAHNFSTSANGLTEFEELEDIKQFNK
jgi:hypothetical protein